MRKGIQSAVLEETRIGGFGVVILVLVTWELFSRAGIVNVHYFPPVSRILKVLVSVTLSGELLTHYGVSLWRAGLGYGTAVLAGIALGLFIGYSRIAFNLAEPLVELLRPIPSAAIIPMIILLLGIGNTMKVFVIGWACLWPVLVNTIDGVRGVDRVLVDTALTFGSNRKEIFLKIILPAASPQIATGMRVSLAFALILAVVSEMIAGNNGIGFYILDSERAFKVAEMYAGTFSLAAVGYSLNRLFVIADNRILAWHKGLTSKEKR